MKKINDKQLEVRRYDKRAQEIINIDKKQYYVKIKEYIYEPYKYYFKLLGKLKNNNKLLEIGAGIGQNTFELIKMNFDVCATDISSKSVKVMNKRFSKYKNFSAKVADMEFLPFKNESFDIICSAGSLSYGDNNLVMDELYRVLKVGGDLVIVDSLNDNFIYRFNRYINYIMGLRSKSTLYRMPDINLINKYIMKFGHGKVRFFGSTTWAFPILKLILSEKKICQCSNWIDKKLKIKKSAFKFVMILKKK